MIRIQNEDLQNSQERQLLGKKKTIKSLPYTMNVFDAIKKDQIGYDTQYIGDYVFLTPPKVNYL